MDQSFQPGEAVRFYDPNDTGNVFLGEVVERIDGQYVVACYYSIRAEDLMPLELSRPE